MVAATDRAGERDIRLRIAMQAKQSEDRAGGPAHHVELFVRGNQLVRKQPCCAFSVLQQGCVAGTFGNHAKTIDDRAQPSCGADAKRTGKASRAAAVQVSADMREAGKGKFGRWCVPADGAMRGKEQRNSGRAVVEIGA